MALFYVDLKAVYTKLFPRHPVSLKRVLLRLRSEAAI